MAAPSRLGRTIMQCSKLGNEIDRRTARKQSRNIPTISRNTARPSYRLSWISLPAVQFHPSAIRIAKARQLLRE